MHPNTQLTLLRTTLDLLDFATYLVMNQNNLETVLPQEEWGHFTTHAMAFNERILAFKEKPSHLQTFEEAEELRNLWGCQFAYYLKNNCVEKSFEPGSTEQISFILTLSTANTLIGEIMSAKAEVAMYEKTIEAIINGKKLLEEEDEEMDHDLIN